MNQGGTPLRFLRLTDSIEGPRVKVALFGEDAEKEYSVGEVIALTETYKYKDTSTLSTKKTCKLEVCIFSAYSNFYNPLQKSCQRPIRLETSCLSSRLWSINVTLNND